MTAKGRRQPVTGSQRGSAPSLEPPTTRDRHHQRQCGETMPTPSLHRDLLVLDDLGHGRDLGFEPMAKIGWAHA